MHATKLKSLLVTAVLTLAVTAGVLLDSEQLTAAPQNGGTSPVHNLQVHLLVNDLHQLLQ